MFGWFGAQGRHITPILVGVPLLAVAQSSFGTRFHIALVTGWSAVMVWAGLGALRRYTVGVDGDNAFSMFTKRTWNPSIGFWISIILLVATTVLVAKTAISSRPAPTDR
jgi:heme/copper-type cytochrome/quinol oxidase subunit 4